MKDGEGTLGEKRTAEKKLKENDKNESWDRTDLMGLYAKSSSFMQQIIAALETVKHRIINADKSHRANRLKQIR